MLSNRICIMSHGKVIAVDKPEAIKRQFGVGYNLFVEPRDAERISDDQRE